MQVHSFCPVIPFILARNLNLGGSGGANLIKSARRGGNFRPSIHLRPRSIDRTPPRVSRLLGGNSVAISARKLTRPQVGRNLRRLYCVAKRHIVGRNKESYAQVASVAMCARRRNSLVCVAPKQKQWQRRRRRHASITRAHIAFVYT